MKKFRAGRPLPMVLLLIPFLYLVFSNPFGEPAQTIVEVIYLCVILGITVLVASRNTDEVEVAAARFSASAGAVAEFIATLAESPSNGLPPAATGFGMGAMAAMLMMFTCAIIAYAAWFWRSTR
jgi:hypothetical protein